MVDLKHKTTKQLGVLLHGTCGGEYKAVLKEYMSRPDRKYKSRGIRDKFNHMIRVNLKTPITEDSVKGFRAVELRYLLAKGVGGAERKILVKEYASRFGKI